MSIVRGPVKRAWPSKSETFGSRSARKLRPATEIGSIRRKIRSRISAQCTLSRLRSTPSERACSAEAARSAGWTNIFVGMQPTLRQVPPKVPFSRIAVRHVLNRRSAMELPEPLPMIARSKWVTGPILPPTGL